MSFAVYSESEICYRGQHVANMRPGVSPSLLFEVVSTLEDTDLERIEEEHADAIKALEDQHAHELADLQAEHAERMAELEADDRETRERLEGTIKALEVDNAAMADMLDTAQGDVDAAAQLVEARAEIARLRKALAEATAPKPRGKRKAA